MRKEVIFCNKFFTIFWWESD